MLRFAKELGDKLISTVCADKLVWVRKHLMTVNIIITTLKEKKYISPNLFCL